MRALNAILGAEHAPKIARLTKNMNRYGMALDKISTPKNYQGAMQQEYATIADTTANHIQLLKNSMTRFGTIVGTALLPVVSAVARGLSGVATRAGDLAQRFPRTTAVFMTGAAVIAGLAVGGLALGLVINGVKTSVASLRSATLLLSNSQRLATIQTWAMTAAGKAWGVASRIAGAGSRFFAGGLRSILVASGVGALLVALGFAVDFVIEHWDTIGPALKGIWEGVVGTISQTVGSIINFFVTGWASITDTWNRLGVFFSVLGGNLLKVFEPAITFITGLFSRAKDICLQVWSGITGFFSGLWEGVTSMAESAWTWITDAASTAWDGVTGLWNGVTSFFAVMWDGVSTGAGVMWGWIRGAASGAWNGVVSVWEGATAFFGGLCDAITGVFASMFKWLRDSFDWVFSTIDTVKSAVSQVTGAVSDAWNTAFGEDGKTPSEKSAPVASGAPEPPKAASMSTSGEKATQATAPASENPAKPSYQERADALAAGLTGTSSDTGKKGKKGGKKGKGAGPVTVVSLDSGSQVQHGIHPGCLEEGQGCIEARGRVRAPALVVRRLRNRGVLESRAEPRRRPEQGLRPPTQALRRFALQGERAGHPPGSRQHRGVFIVPTARPARHLPPRPAAGPQRVGVRRVEERLGRGPGPVVPDGRREVRPRCPSARASSDADVAGAQQKGSRAAPAGGIGGHPDRAALQHRGRGEFPRAQKGTPASGAGV